MIEKNVQFIFSQALSIQILVRTKYHILPSTILSHPYCSKVNRKDCLPLSGLRFILPTLFFMLQRQVIQLRTSQREELVDITAQVKKATQELGVKNGILSIYAQGATAAIMIQENWDSSVPRDVVHLLQQLIPRGIWLHDQQDGNGDSHLKAGLVGPSETIPIIEGKLGLSRWQGIFFCEFDGPRQSRQVICTALGTY